jgi:hypothetical protein
VNLQLSVNHIDNCEVKAGKLGSWEAGKLGAMEI